MRPFFWGLAVLTLLFFSAVLYTESDDFERRSAAWALQWLSDRLERDVTASDVRVDIFPLVIDARDFEISGAEPGSPAFARASRIVVEATIGSLLRPGIALDHLVAESPEVRIGFDAEGRHDAPRWRRRGTEPLLTPINVSIGVLEVSSGTLIIDHDRYPLNLAARRVRADLTGGSGLEVLGRAAIGELDLQLPDARPYSGSVEMDARFRAGRVDIRQARLSGPFAQATLSGTWKWRESRDVDLRIVADGDLEIFDHLGYLDQFGEGAFRFEGGFRRRPGEWFLDGDLTAPAVQILGRRIGSIAGQVVADRQALRLEIESGRYGGGSLEGRVLMALESAGSRPVSVALELTGVDADRLLEDQAIPVRGISAVVSGPVSYTFERGLPRRGDGRAELTIAPRAATAGAKVPMSGQALLTITRGELWSRSTRLASDSHAVLIDGRYDLETGAAGFDYSVTTRRVEELFPLLPDLGEPGLWQPERGSGSLTGSLQLDGGDVSASVALDLDNVEAPGYTATELHGSLLYGRGLVDELRLELARPGGAMIVTGAVPVDAARGAELRIAVDSVAWPLADVSAWSPWDLAGLDGRFTGALELAGDPERPQGSLAGSLSEPVLGPLEALELDLDLVFGPESLAVETAGLTLAAGRIDLVGSLGFADEGEEKIDFDISSESLVLETLPFVEEIVADLAGQVAVRSNVSGTLSDPVIEASIVCREISIGSVAETRRAAPVSKVEVEWVNGRIRVDGAIGDLIEVRGGGSIDGGSVDTSFEVDSTRLGEVLALWQIPGADDVAGRGRGTLGVAGDLVAPGGLIARLSLAELTVERPAQKLRNLEPVAIVFGADGIEIESLYLAESDSESEVFVAGLVRQGEDRRLDLNLQASLAAEWFQPWLPDLEIRGGDFHVIGSVSGTAERPRFNGQGELEGARVLIDGFASSFDDIRGLVLFYPDRVVLDEAAAGLAGGDLRAGGAVEIRPDGGMPYRFQVSGEDLSFRYPEGWLVRGDTELIIESVPSGRQVGGVLNLQSARYVEDVQLIRGLFERQRVEAGDVEPWRSETYLNLAVDLPGGLKVDNNIADLSGSARLGLRGSVARPVVFGSVELDPGGELLYNGQEYLVERGQLNFTNPYRIEPVLDLVAKTRMREFDVTLSLSGTPDRLQTEFVSNPPLAELEVLALLAGGRDPGARSADREEVANEGGAAESFLYGQATSLIAGRFNRLFGLDQFRIDPLTSATGDLSSARITVGKQLSRDLFVTYSYDPSETGEQILEVEWSLSRSLTLVLTQNGDGSYAVDARWEKAL